MFSTVTHPTSRLCRFFFPSLQPLEIVKNIIASLDDRHSKTIYLPLYATLSPLAPLAPSFVRDLMQRVSVSDYPSSRVRSSLTLAWEQLVGADYSMREFTKNGGEGAGERGEKLENQDARRK